MKGHLEQRLHPKVQEPVQRIRSGMQGVIQRKVPIAAVLRNADTVAVGICPAVFRRLRTVECRFQEKMERRHFDDSSLQIELCNAVSASAEETRAVAFQVFHAAERKKILPVKIAVRR